MRAKKKGVCFIIFFLEIKFESRGQYIEPVALCPITGLGWGIYVAAAL
jgi:hypothetical protein